MCTKIQKYFLFILHQFDIRVFANFGLQKSKKCILLIADACMAKTNSTIRFCRKKYRFCDCIELFLVYRAGSAKFQKLSFRVVTKKRLKTISRAMYLAQGPVLGRKILEFFIQFQILPVRLKFQILGKFWPGLIYTFKECDCLSMLIFAAILNWFTSDNWRQFCGNILIPVM